VPRPHIGVPHKKSHKKFGIARKAVPPLAAMATAYNLKNKYLHRHPTAKKEVIETHEEYPARRRGLSKFLPTSYPSTSTSWHMPHIGIPHKQTEDVTPSTSTSWLRPHIGVPHKKSKIARKAVPPLAGMATASKLNNLKNKYLHRHPTEEVIETHEEYPVRHRRLSKFLPTSYSSTAYESAPESVPSRFLGRRQQQRLAAQKRPVADVRHIPLMGLLGKAIGLSVVVGLGTLAWNKIVREKYLAKRAKATKTTNVKKTTATKTHILPGLGAKRKPVVRKTTIASKAVPPTVASTSGSRLNRMSQRIKNIYARRRRVPRAVETVETTKTEVRPMKTKKRFGIFSRGKGYDY